MCERGHLAAWPIQGKKQAVMPTTAPDGPTGLFGGRRMALRRNDEQAFVFKDQRAAVNSGIELIRIAGVQMHMLARQDLLHDVISADAQNGVMEVPVSTGKTGIATCLRLPADYRSASICWPRLPSSANAGVMLRAS